MKRLGQRRTRLHGGTVGSVEVTLPPEADVGPGEEIEIFELSPGALLLRRAAP